MDRVGESFAAPDALDETALALYDATEDAEWAYGWLLGRYRALHLGDSRVEKTILDLAGLRTGDRDDPELDGIASRRVANLVELGDVEAARKVLRSAGGVLSDGEKRRLYGRVADRLAPSRWEEAADVMVELAWDRLNAGQIRNATDAVARARGLWQDADGPAPDWLLQCLEAVERAWADCEPVLEWRKSDDERRRDVLRSRLLHRRILIAGGQRNQDWVDHLQELTGADVDWCRAFHDETDDLAGFAHRIENGRYDLVVHYLHKTGHQTAEVLRPACERCGVAWVDATSPGRRGVVEAVWLAVGPNGEGGAS